MISDEKYMALDEYYPKGHIEKEIPISRRG